MKKTEPATELDQRYSREGVDPTPWSEARRALEEAPLYWLSTVRPDGRPHVTPLIGVWASDAVHFCTGPDERKARNLETNTRCVLTTGSNALDAGLDIAVEGEAARVRDDARLQALADAYEAKYGSAWHFDVRDGAFHHEGGSALVFGVAPTTAFAFAKGAYGQTRYRFV